MTFFYRFMQEIEFFKMQGLGNDYVYLVCLDTLPEDMPTLAKDISDRHFGVGGDGMVIVTRSAVADFRMIMFNADGSQAQMCGNASRCIGRLVYETGLTDKKELTLETLAGIKRLTLNFDGPVIRDVSVNMGRPILSPDKIPVAKGAAPNPVALRTVEVGGRSLDLHCVGLGNPHGVIFGEVTEEFFRTYGSELEHHPVWPEKANIEFVKVTAPHSIEMRVWERGTGETLACGTGACASAVASILTGRTANDVNVRMKGGTLNIRLDENGEVIMTGDAQFVAHGTYYWNK